MTGSDRRDHIIALEWKSNITAHQVWDLVGILNHQFQYVILKPNKQTLWYFDDLLNITAFLYADTFDHFIVFHNMNAIASYHNDSVAKKEFVLDYRLLDFFQRLLRYLPLPWDIV